MAVIPIAGLVVALLWFRKRFTLNEQKMAEINRALIAKAQSEMSE